MSSTGSAEREGYAGVGAVTTTSAEEAVTTALRNAILSGQLAPGARLAQAELAEQLGVSRIPLRDALRRLEEDSLVRIDGRRGTWVTALDMSDVAEIYELRIFLEAQCARYAISNLTDDNVQTLLTLSAEMDRAKEDPVAGRQARRAFYAELYSHAGRPRMHRLILQLRDNVGRYHLLSDTDHSREAHADMRRCIETRDADGAVELITSHLEEARDDLLAIMAEELTSEASRGTGSG